MTLFRSSRPVATAALAVGVLIGGAGMHCIHLAWQLDPYYQMATMLAAHVRSDEALFADIRYRLHSQPVDVPCSVASESVGDGPELARLSAEVANLLGSLQRTKGYVRQVDESIARIDKATSTRETVAALLDEQQRGPGRRQ